MNAIRKHFGIIVSHLIGQASALGAAALCGIAGCGSAENEVTTYPTTQPARGEVMLTICYDNNRGPDDLTPAWGFACVVRGLEKTILFDTGGDGRTLLANMTALDIEPAEIEVVVLSHVHGDHTGGLWDFLRHRGGLPVFTPSGFPPGFHKRVKGLGGEPTVADPPTTVCEGARTTGTMGKGQIEEHGLCVKTAKGWVLITGCAHPGIADMAERATKVVEGPLHLVIGGFHMTGASEREIEAVIERFEELGVATVAPCHCSGDKTRRLFKAHYGERYTPACVGTSMRFPRKDGGEVPP